MTLKIQRKRWVIIRQGNNEAEILCGLARQFHFKPLSEVGDTAIKTYLSEKKALASFESSWRNPKFEYKAVPVIETIESVIL